MNDPGEIILFQTEDGQTRIDVRPVDETVWLSAGQMAELFQRDKSVILKHVKNVFAEGELDPGATVANFAIVQREGGREVSPLDLHRLRHCPRGLPPAAPPSTTKRSSDYLENGSLTGGW